MKTVHLKKLGQHTFSCVNYFLIEPIHHVKNYRKYDVIIINWLDGDSMVASSVGDEYCSMQMHESVSVSSDVIFETFSARVFISGFYVNRLIYFLLQL